MEKIKKFIENHIVDIVCITAFVFFVFGCWCLYTANRTTNEYHDVTDTVQQAEADNRSARQQIGNASEQIESAEKQLNRSIQRTDRITERTQQAKKRVNSNSKIIGECQNLIDAGRRDASEARSIFADIDKANKTDGTQADSNPQAERCICDTVIVVRGRGNRPEVIHNLKSYRLTGCCNNCNSQISDSSFFHNYFLIIFEFF